MIGVVEQVGKEISLSAPDDTPRNSDDSDAPGDCRLFCIESNLVFQTLVSWEKKQIRWFGGLVGESELEKGDLRLYSLPFSRKCK